MLSKHGIRLVDAAFKKQILKMKSIMKPLQLNTKINGAVEIIKSLEKEFKVNLIELNLPVLVLNSGRMVASKKANL